MRVLIACEESQAVCKAFRAKGHEAYSCDVQDCSGGRPEWHLIGDVLDFLSDGWDLLIGHPPCQFLTFAGIGYFNVERYGEKAVQRHTKKDLALTFFQTLLDAPIPAICLENPVGWVNKTIKPSQTFHPYQFGDPHVKRTCLWLKGLPLLRYVDSPIKPVPITVQVRRPSKRYKGGELKPRYYSDSVSSGPEQSKIRAKTFPGVARAMAEQWTEDSILDYQLG